MGTLWSELAPIATGRAETPRIYADANVPAGVVTFMRETLRWDVLFVVEHDDLRRAHDIEHFRLARQLHRTLITMDRDYLDDRVFPPAETAGVVVLSAPDERGLRRLLERVNQAVFHDGSDALIALPLEGAKLQVFPEFGAGQR
jgi:predicted nuclease of predicted toxin-antitoxin system